MKFEDIKKFEDTIKLSKKEMFDMVADLRKEDKNRLDAKFMALAAGNDLRRAILHAAGIPVPTKEEPKKVEPKKVEPKAEEEETKPSWKP